jgi:hypothetical protein
MAELQKLKAKVLAEGILGDHEVEIICRELYADGRIDQAVVEFLSALREEAQSVCPTFEELYFEVVKHHVLADGSIDAEMAAWLRRLLFADGKIDEREKQLLWDLKREAARVSREFQRLYDEYL